VAFDATRSFSFGDTTRDYHVMLPKRPSTDMSSRRRSGLVHPERLPAVLMLHGYGSDAVAFASSGQMAAEGAHQGFLMAYLDGPPRPESKASTQERCWNSGSCGDHAAARNIADTEYVAKVVADMVEHFDVDSARVFVAGISNGGSMALRLACERPDLFAAVSAVHGSLEFRDGSHCSGTCDKAAGLCTWDTSKSGCGQEEWVSHLPAVYGCSKLANHPLQMLMVNGERTPWGTDKGGMYDNNGGSWPPLHFQQRYMIQTLGCHESLPSFHSQTGSEGAASCRSFGDCHGGNLTLCEVQGGDWWYGEEYDAQQICLYCGYTPAECSPKAQTKMWGPNSKAIELTQQILRFFAQSPSKAHA